MIALAVTSKTWSGASSSRKILQSAGRNVLGGQLSKQRSTLSDMGRYGHSSPQHIIPTFCAAEG